MPTEINWGYINSGFQFESLIHVLLFHIDPKTRLSGRPGKDRGIDAKSNNGLIVYQAKYHMNGDIKDLITDAKKELKKIKEYRKRGHSNYAYWKDVSEWVIVSNIDMNETDMQAWDSEIVSEFKNEGITAQYPWHRIVIEARLVNFPNIIHHYFEGKNRVVLSLSEARNYINDRSIITDVIDLEVVGWTENLTSFKSFLRNENLKILPIIGNAGIGKTRFLYECANMSITLEPDRLVYWAITEELGYGDWFRAIPPGSKCLLIIDEPEDASLVERICAQLSSYSTLDWKILISSRKTKFRITNILKNKYYNYISDIIEIRELSVEETRELVLKTIDYLGMNNIDKNKLLNIFTSDIFFKTPVWIFLGISILKKSQNLTSLPIESSKYVEQYINEALIDSDNFMFYKNILYWVGLYSYINIESENSFEFIVNNIQCNKGDFEKALIFLTNQGLLINKGIRNRIYEIKPDIIRDYIIKDYLIIRDNIISENGKNLIKLLMEGKIPEFEKILKTLSYVEYALSRDVSLLEPIFEQLVAISNDSKEGNVLYNIIHIINHIAYNNIQKTLLIFNNILKKQDLTPLKTSSIYGEFEIGYFEIVKEIPWIIFSICSYAYDELESILYFMKDMVILENNYNEEQKQLLKNNGKSARALFSRILSDEMFSKNYSATAVQMSNEYVNKIKINKNIDPQEVELIKILFIKTYEVERNVHRYHDYKIEWWKEYINLGSQLWRERLELIRQIESIIDDIDMEESIKVLMWEILSELHRQINVAIGVGNKNSDNLVNADIDTLVNKMKDDLLFVRNQLKVNKMSISEKKASRDIWDWHTKFEKKYVELKDIAIECEDIFMKDEVIFELQKLSSWREYSEIETIENTIIQKIINIGVIEIEKLIKNWKSFNKNNYFYIGGIAKRLGSYITKHSFLYDFIINNINSEDTAVYKFVISIINGYLKYLRDNGGTDNCIKFQEEILKITHNKSNLLYTLYYDTRPFIGIVGDNELNYIINCLNEYVDDAKMFSWIIGGLFYVNFDTCAKVVDEKWEKINIEDKTSSFTNLLTQISTSILFEEDFNFKYNISSRDWIFNKIKCIPDLDGISGIQHELDDIIDKTEKLPLIWFKEFLFIRKELEEKYKDEKHLKISPIPHQLKIINWVKSDDSLDDYEKIINDILQLNSYDSLTGYYLPSVITEIINSKDLSLKIINKINSAEINDVPKWARYAGEFEINSLIWRDIAIAALVRISKEPGKIDKKNIYSVLLPNSMKSWTTLPGTVAGIFYDEVEKIEKYYKLEDNKYLKIFWEWDLKIARAELDQQKGLIEEEK